MDFSAQTERRPSLKRKKRFFVPSGPFVHPRGAPACVPLRSEVGTTVRMQESRLSTGTSLSALAASFPQDHREIPSLPLSIHGTLAWPPRGIFAAFNDP